MKTSILTFSAMGSLLVLSSSCATTQVAEGPGRSCFRSDEVTSWYSPDATNFIATVSATEVYSARLSGCPSLADAQQVAVLPRFGGQICEGGNGTLRVRGADLRQARCRASNFQRLSPQAISALPPAARR